MSAKPTIPEQPDPNRARHEAVVKLGARIDWARPELPSAAREAHRAGDAWAAALELVRYLRHRERPVIAPTHAWVEHVRAAASEAQRRDARAQLERDLPGHIAQTARHTIFLRVAPKTYYLGADAAHFQLIAEHVLAAQDRWGEGGFGATRAIGVYLRAAWPLEACPDEALVPVLAWLLVQAEAEWDWSRTWGEAMLGPSGHNWWVATFGGLAQAGLMLPEAPGVARFAALLPDWLEREVALLFQPDGFTRERSGYHWGTVTHLLDLVLLAQRNGITFSERFERHLQRIAEVDWKLITPDGDLPGIGDTRPRHQPGGLVPALRRNAALLKVGRAKWVAERLAPGWSPPYRELWPQFDQDLWQPYCDCDPVAPEEPDTCLPDSGYYVIRENWTPRADWACLDAGARGETVTSHDHASPLHLLLHSKGRPILVDNSSGPYANDPPERMWRISSAAHNLATVDGESAVAVRSGWRWDQTVVPRVEAWVHDKDFAYFSGTHEGYARLTEPVPATRRKVFYLRGQYWIIIDRFTAASDDAAHTYDLHFHLGAPGELNDNGRFVTHGDHDTDGNLLILPVEGARGTPRHEPNPYPLDGYDNPDHLCYTQHTTGSALFVTVLVPFIGARPPRVAAHLLELEADVQTLSPWEATALHIEIDGQRDLYVDHHMHWHLPWRAGGYEDTARLHHSRVALPRLPLTAQPAES
ncbi:MAG: alginate lyase family protein [Phycisphaeraceae bacterium]